MNLLKFLRSPARRRLRASGSRSCSPTNVSRRDNLICLRRCGRRSLR